MIGAAGPGEASLGWAGRAGARPGQAGQGKGITDCCGGYAEHFDWCEVGQSERARLRHDGCLADFWVDGWHS